MNTNEMRIWLTTVVKSCVLSFVIVVPIGCSTAQQQTQPPPANERTFPTASTQTTASFSPLNEQDLKRLDERFPSRQREVLQNALSIDVYEFDDRFPIKDKSNALGLWPIEKNKFQGYGVSRHARVSDNEQRKELVEGLLYSIGSSGNGMACFGPRHGIRAVHKGERIELLICFECENFQGAPTFGSPVTDFAGNRVEPSEKFSGGFSPAVEPLFERILSRASSKPR